MEYMWYEGRKIMFAGFQYFIISGSIPNGASTMVL